jgi:hypothetical protein
VWSNLGDAGCGFGGHMLEIDEDVRFGLLEEEGIRFDDNGRILGRRLEFFDVEESMKGATIEKYVDGFLCRCGCWN